jgi:ClpP class serine protease
MDLDLASKAEEERSQASEALSPFSELLSKIDEEAKNVEKVLGCQPIVLAFHDSAGIERNVVDDFEFYVMERNLNTESDVCILLHTLGGDADAAYHLGIRMQNLTNKQLIMVVPRLAKSAGTLLACSGNKILATPITELGPVDPQVQLPGTGRYVSAKTIRDSLKQAIETIKETRTSEEQIVGAVFSGIPIAEMGHYESLLNHVKSLLEDILSRRMKKDRKEVSEIAEKLTKGYVYHGKAIHVEEAKDVGLEIEILTGDKLKAVYNIYQTLKRLFDALNEQLEPLMYVAKIPLPVRPYKIQLGIIYMPSIEGWLARALHIFKTKGLK